MEQEFESKANSIKIQIEDDFNTFNETELEKFFERFIRDKRNSSFIEYYNETVLNGARIKFGTFNYWWGIQGMRKEVSGFFSNNFDKLKKEIQEERDIKKFFKEHCCAVREESSFCSKLFHTILPGEFPPIDNPIKNKFHLNNEDFIESVLIIKRGYELFIKENQDKIDLIRKLLKKPQFACLRINELSDIRILDMYYWFKENIG